MSFASDSHFLLILFTLLFTLLFSSPTFASHQEQQQPYLSSTNMSAPAGASSSAAFIAAIAGRRSIYQLNKTLPGGVTQGKIQELVNQVSRFFFFHSLREEWGRGGRSSEGRMASLTSSRAHPIMLADLSPFLFVCVCACHDA